MNKKPTRSPEAQGSSESSALIEVENLSHSFSDGTEALKDLTFSVHEGEFILCAGPNGSGKTVCMRHLNALYLPSSGEVRILGRSTRKDQSWARQTVGMVFQDADSQIVGQTVLQDIRFGPENLRLTEEEIAERSRHALTTMQLEDLSQHRPHQLSGGEKRRLAIAGILAMSPKVIILDEPFSNLDYPGVRSVLSYIVQLHRQGHTIILVTHDVEKVIAHADRMLIFDSGRIAEDDTPSALIPSLERYGMRPLQHFNGDLAELSWLK